MIYENISKAVFLERPNRFIAHMELDGVRQVCHVKNTGRCAELLVPGATIYVQKAANPARKTAWDLIAVRKGQRLINMDAAAPNCVFGEYLAAGGLGFVPEHIKPECRQGDSRFDFYFQAGQRRGFVEVKGVTLETEGIVRFPDAPTLRGVKHLLGLAQCAKEGLEAWAVFIVQMAQVRCFEPNWATHPAFGRALLEARAAGVHILALDCAVTENSICAGAPIPLHLERP